MARTVHEPLPPRAEALSLFRDYFDNFNFIVPLFHEPTFMHLVERQYSGDPYKSGAWWACINVVLSLAHTLRALNKINPREEQKKSWLYFKNALGVFTELALLNTDLLTVQALLGMVTSLPPFFHLLCMLIEIKLNRPSSCRVPKTLSRASSCLPMPYAPHMQSAFIDEALLSI